MKVTRIYLRDLLVSMGHRSNIDSSLFSIEQVDIGFLIDNRVIVPFSNCKEILVSVEKQDETIVTMFDEAEQSLNKKKSRKAA